jgi:hypothetical protein
VTPAAERTVSHVSGPIFPGAERERILSRVEVRADRGGKGWGFGFDSGVERRDLIDGDSLGILDWVSAEQAGCSKDSMSVEVFR